MRVSVSLPASETLHTLVVGIEVDPETVNREQLHRAIRRHVNDALDTHAQRDDPAVLERVLLYTANRFGLAPHTIVSRSRTADVLRARQVAYVAAIRCGLSYSEVGRQTERDHTTVMSGVRNGQRIGDVVRAASEIVEQVTMGCEDCGRPAMGGGKWCLACYQHHAAGDRRRAS